MKDLYIAVAAAALVTFRIVLFRRRRRRRAAAETAPVATEPSRQRTRERRNRLGDVGEIAMREITERLRGRIFRVGTLLILLVVALAIIIPTLDKSSSGPTRQTVGVVGGISPQLTLLLRAAASSSGDRVTVTGEPSLGVAREALRKGRIDEAVVSGQEVLLEEPAAAKSSPADPTFVQNMAAYLGLAKAYHSAGLTPAQAATITRAAPLPVRTVRAAAAAPTVKAGSIVGLVLLFFMLSQYCTWILIGVMQEKSSRVVEVLLATVRPIQLLGGKVLGIGLVALGQAALVVGFALVVGDAAGSDLLKGAAPLVLLCELAWLVLGYSFYCWLYAAAGSMAERQDQVQTLALPLSIPILLGYIFSITVASTGNPDLFFKILAYVPFTAPFCMSVLVGLGQATWWEFVVSVAVTIASTVAMASFAARIYRRAVLRTGGRVRLRELLSHGSA